MPTISSNIKTTEISRCKLSLASKTLGFDSFDSTLYAAAKERGKYPKLLWKTYFYSPKGRMHLKLLFFFSLEQFFLLFQ